MGRRKDREAALARLTELQDLTRDAQAELVVQMLKAREAGASWIAIGKARSMTPQACYQALERWKARTYTYPLPPDDMPAEQA